MLELKLICWSSGQHLHLMGQERKPWCVWELQSLAPLVVPLTTHLIRQKYVHKKCLRERILSRYGFSEPLLDKTWQISNSWDTHAGWGREQSSGRRVEKEVSGGIKGLRVHLALMCRASKILQRKCPEIKCCWKVEHCWLQQAEMTILG